MRILITGGAGFIGSNLAQKLLNNGDQVVSIDNLSTGTKTNITILEQNKNFKFIKDDILNYDLMQKLIKNCDHIYHLAAAVGVKYVIEHQLQSLITNVQGTEIVLKLASNFKKKVFFASSSEVYGKNGVRAFKENDDRVLGSVDIPRWGYAFAKGFDEFLAMAYYQEKQLPVVIGRLFNICGPGQMPHYGMVIPRFIEQALKHEPITVYGDGEQVRSFTYIEDAVWIMKALMQNTKAEGQIINIGSSQPVTIKTLAYKIKEFTQSKSKIVFVNHKKIYDKKFEDMFYRVPNISKMQEYTGYKPSREFDLILKKIINNYRGK
ncbi:MAG: SDR family NAD(P)-dependent oxidoreductase [Candidatus Omnitrophota bacterium]